jgi:hypothetical protein
MLALLNERLLNAIYQVLSIRSFNSLSLGYYGSGVYQKRSANPAMTILSSRRSATESKDLTNLFQIHT